jgi:hypothetical protein
VNQDQVSRFFAYAAEREAIRERRAEGLRPPWTNDPILGEYRFCNIHREDDRVTSWFRENIRNPLRSRPEVFYATAMFRWFNRVETAREVMRITEAMNLDALTAYRRFEPHIMRMALSEFRPLTNAAYIIKTPNGMNKLEGIIQCLEWLTEQEHCPPGYDLPVGLEQMCDALLSQPGDFSLQEVHEWLVKFPYLGGFMAYEIVTDLRHTDLLCKAPDVFEWANAGPGAVRGLNRLQDRPLDKGLSQGVACTEMRALLEDAHERGLDSWEMREVEHTLCEFDKYERERLCQGHPKQRFSAARNPIPQSATT